ncbi:MAG: carboxypeptidase-like regulatory domain-containing protein [Marinobacterium sp.]|nr:carboxypeptidase-like regulatory domain-containing protein [Marinobacterium sp.]
MSGLFNPIAAASAVAANTLSGVSGSIQDSSNGDPVPSAIVNVGPHSTATDANGHYDIYAFVPPGTVMTINANGYNGTTRTVSSGVVNAALTPSR